MFGDIFFEKENRGGAQRRRQKGEHCTQKSKIDGGHPEKTSLREKGIAIIYMIA